MSNTAVCYRSPIEIRHHKSGKALCWEYEDGGNGVGIKGLKRFVKIISECLETSLPNAMVQQAICLIFQLYAVGENCGRSQITNVEGVGLICRHRKVSFDDLFKLLK